MEKKHLDVLTEIIGVTGIFPDSIVRENMTSTELEQIIESYTKAQIKGLEQTQKRIDALDKQIEYMKDTKRR